MAAQPGTGLVDRVYREILGAIVAGEFKEGDKLPTELALTERHDASRPTIREALARLRADGITSTWACMDAMAEMKNWLPEARATAR